MNPDWDDYIRASDGDEAAWTRLLARHHGRLIRMTYLITGSWPAAQDLAQETMIKLLRQGVRHRNGSLAAYLSTMAYYLALKEKKRAGRQCDLDGTEPIDRAPSPLDTMLRKEKDRLLAQAIGSLDEAHRDVLVLRLYGEQSYTEIARIMKLPLGTVKSRMFYAVKACQAHLRKRGILS